MLTANAVKNKKGQKKISVLTCYDFATAAVLNSTSLDMLLVGDSMAEVVYGYANTTFITMDLMLNHVMAVKKGAPDKHVIADMPWQSDTSPAAALRNARKFIQTGADSVKLENPSTAVVSELIENEIAVMGHVGLTPQTIHNYQLQGKDPQTAERITRDAQRLAQAGCYALVLEAIPASLAEHITAVVAIPTICIAAGKKCDGQVLVINDMLGFDQKQRPYVKKYADYFSIVKTAVEQYIKEIKTTGS
ncbi:MAG TPA: 3-methyl-2-oxobutanoate hydroxymethyltransferase [Spirochaetota bacterium]|nr:3-methyl-2-oxobutanoate hydroxymethyltransferase [Spirochaetota bacterium]